MVGAVNFIGLQAGKGMSLSQLAQATRRMPGAMWVAQADAMDHAFRSFWKALKPRMEIKRAGGRFTLTSPRAWPITITTTPTPSHEAPNWSKFRARMGTDSTAALLLETGGVVTPRNARLLAIPVGGARGPSGRVRPGFTSPAGAKAKGKKFIAIRDKHGRVRLHELVKKKGPPGRRRKGSPPAEIAPNPEAAYLLVARTRHRPRLHFHETFNARLPETRAIIARDLARTVREVLAGKTPTAISARAQAVPV